MIGKITPKQLGFALTSFVLGVWAFMTVSAISGPAFEPIIAACANPDYKYKGGSGSGSGSGSGMDKFVAESGYHAYEPMVGLKVFELLVCLITQFIFELNQTYPAGIVTWGGLILVAQTVAVLGTIEAGRKGARGFIRYSILFGILGQLFGISVVFPLLWVPAYIWGRGNGPISKRRIHTIIPLSLPAILLTVAVFGLDTDSYAWMVCAGMLGGPVLPMVCGVLWTDVPPEKPSKETIQASINSVKKVYTIAAIISGVGYHLLIYLVYGAYASASASEGGGFGNMLGRLWSEIWTDANPSVAFMTIDMGVLYLGILLVVAYQDTGKALKAIILTPLFGPAAASLVLAELEETRCHELQEESEKEDSKKKK
jgi:hypothetical protein